MNYRAIATCLILILLSVAASVFAGADDAMRNWTEWNGKTFRGKIAGFDLARFTVSTKAGEVEIDGSAYKSLPAQRRKLVDTVLDDEGFANPGEALAKGGGKPREFDYITVRFLTEAGREVKLPLELLQGAEEGTGDYRIAADKSLEWLKDREADRKREAQTHKDASESQRRRAEQQQREDAVQRRWAHSRRHRHYHPDYWRERERREQLERQRKELAKREAELKERQRKQKEEQAKKDKAKRDKARKDKEKDKDKAKKDKDKKDPPKKDPPKKSPPKKDPPKKDKSKKPDSK